MDHNDKRNPSVPLGTFAQETESLEREDVTQELDTRDLEPKDETLPGVRIDSEAQAPRQRVRTLLGVPALDLFPGHQPLAAVSGEQRSPEEITHVLDDVHVLLEPHTPHDHDDHDDHDAAEVTVVSDSVVTALPDSVPSPEPNGILQVPPSVRSYEQREQTENPQPLLVPSPQPEAKSRTRSGQGEVRVVSAQTTGRSLSPANFSSLAPREVARPAPKQTRGEPSSRAGLLLVAAAMLLATGAWFVTGGSFRRATLSEASIPQQPVAVSKPMAATEETTRNDAIANTLPQSTPQPLAADAANAVASVSGPAPATAPANDGTGLHPKHTVKGSSHTLRAKRAPGPKPELGGDMPESPTRGDVLQRLESVRSSVQACAAGRSGVADLDITIAHTGTVMHVLVGGDFAGTTQGSCIARAVREARFPIFKQERFRLLYPYAI